MRKILFLHNNDQDYLSESVFHGLRSLLGNNCVDFPRYEIMYDHCGEMLRKKLRGNGFSLYGLLSDNEFLKSERFRCLDFIDKFDTVIISNIWSQHKLLSLILKKIAKNKIVVLDGADISSVYPYANFYGRLKNNVFAYLFSCNDYKYFKREIEDNSFYNVLGHIMRPIGLQYKVERQFLPISFSIPQEKITYVKAENKLKTFQTHIVDEEIALKIKESQFSAIGSDKLFFNTEETYFKDLQESKFGITTKRGGWDCLRHYELAANGAVICFKDLNKKSTNCAPNIVGSDCIAYDNYEHLITKIGSITELEYNKYLKLNYSWIEANTTIAKAEYLINKL
jgi:hypothetical protein